MPDGAVIGDDAFSGNDDETVTTDGAAEAAAESAQAAEQGSGPAATDENTES